MKLRFLFFAVATALVVSCSTSDRSELVYPENSGWQWAKSFTGTTSEDEIDAVTSDQLKNVFVSGKFERTLRIQGNDVPFTSAGRADIMVAKYDSAGNLLWAKQFGGPGEDNIFDAACDSQGNLILSGYFQGSVQFGNAITLHSRGGLDMVVIKIDTQGTVLWALQAGGDGDDGGNEVAVGSSGQIVVGAQSTGPFENFTNSGSQDAYVLSLAPTGTISWIRSVQGLGSARAKAITVDAQGNVYLGGDFFGPTNVVAPQGVVALAAVGGWDAYMTSWTASGALRWSKSWGGPGDDLCKGVAVNQRMEIFMVGQFGQTVDFDGSQLTASSPQNLYLWKVSQTAASVWVNRISSSEPLYGAEIELDRAGGVLFGLGLSGTTEFQGGSRFVTVSTPGVGRWPALIQYTSDGTFSRALFADKSTNARFGELSRSGNRVYLDCVFEGGPHQFGPDQLTSAAGNKDAAIVAIKID